MKYQTSKRSTCLVTTVLACACVTLTLVGCASRAGQQINASTVPDTKQDINDQAIFAQQGIFEAQQGRIKALNDSGKHSADSYPLAKAQCWLDVSNHETSRNDRSNFPRLAFDESSKITQELKATGISTSAKLTPLVNDAAKLRPDLWDAVAKLKIHTGWKCSQQQTACAEVELVHAGNEFNQQQWRHAKPYVQIAEDLIGNAQKTAEACNPASTAKAAPPSVRP